jgi:hypothetical protein
MTSPQDAIIDDQVNADAFMIPSTPEQLDSELGKPEPPPVTLWDAAGLNLPTPSQSTKQPVQPVGANPVSNRGQSFGYGPDSAAHGSVGLDFSEPPPGPGPAQGQGAIPAGEISSQPGNAPAQPGATPQPGASENKQTPPENKPVPQPAPGGEQPAPQGAAPGQTQGGQTAATLTIKPGRLTVRIPDLDKSAVDRQSNEDDSSQALSVIFGTALFASAGHHFALRQRDRSQGRAIPRWFGAERPNRLKRATGSG